MTTRQFLCFVALLMSMVGAVAAQPGATVQPGGLVTRQGQAFAELEEALLAAIRAGNTAALQARLADDFEMRVAMAPSAPTPRDDWLDNLRKAGAGDWKVNELHALEAGDVAVVSFVMQALPARKKPSLYVVDTWQRRGGTWLLLHRHVASTGGSRAAVPGDGPVGAVRKKF